MTFEELGATLRAEREKRNLNIDDVANQLKISPRQLRALENGDMGALPHPAYARGFIRSYASWLGMGNEEIQRALENIQTGEIVKPAPGPQKNSLEVHMPEPAAKEPRKGGKGIAALLLLCALGAAAYYAWQNGYLDGFLPDRQVTSEKLENKLPSADSYMAAKDAERNRQQQDVTAASNEPPTASVTDTRKENNRETVPAPIQGGAMKDEIEKSISVAAQPQAAEPATSGLPPVQDQHKLIITAIEECWVHSNADKTDTRQFSLRKGDTFALTFADSLELKLGNAGGVRLRYDGNDLPAPGTSGQVKTLTFPPKSNS